MKELFKKILVILAIIGITSSIINLFSPRNVFAVEIPTNCNHFLGLTPWNCGIEDINDESTLKAGIWKIVTNISIDITVIATYLVLGYVIYGGYQYMFSGGDAGKVANGKKTLVHAFIGLAIVMLANVIMSTIRIVLIQNGNLGSCDTITGTGAGCVDPSSLVDNIIGWFIGIAGLVSVIFLVYGGITYITSSGDSAKLQKAKQTITYSLIGLAIVVLATVITAFVSNTIRNAGQTSLLNDNYISKEVYEIKTN